MSRAQPVRAELGDILKRAAAAKDIGGFQRLFQRVLLAFRKAHEQLSQDTFSAWFLGDQFPRTQRRQDLLGDAIGGSLGRAIKALRAPAFRYWHPPSKSETTTMTKGKHPPRFLMVRRPDESGKLVKQAEIVCASCGEKEHHYRRGSVSSEEHFSKKGWEVGRDASRDFCPACVLKRKVVRMSDHVKTPPHQQQEQPKPEREMSKEEGRIILHAIEARYDEPAKSYQPGWSDLKIAEEQRAPIAWVRKVREEHFDGSGDDPSVARFIAEQIQIKATQTEQDKKFEELSNSVANTSKLLEAYRLQHQKQQERVARLDKLAEKIQSPFRRAG